jgi:hypothetical protein
MMNEKQTELYYFFEDKAKRLQHEINLEIAKIGGEAMLPYRVDLLYWVEKSRGQIENCRLICRLLEDRAEDVDTETVLRKLRETMESDQDSIAELQRKREEIDQTLKQLHEEAEYYQKALEVLGR